MEFLTLFAENGSSGLSAIFPILGIDWRSMIFQLIAFGILFFILTKFVYPPILAMLDRRDKTIKDSLKLAEEQSKKSESMAAEIAQKLAEARRQSEEILVAAKNQSQEILEKADTEATERSERILTQAHQQIQNETAAAREALRSEMVELISLATEKITRGNLTAKIDEQLVAETIAEISQNSEKNLARPENSEKVRRENSLKKDRDSEKKLQKNIKKGARK